MQDISKKFKFFKLRKRLWRSRPYRFYLRLYNSFLTWIINVNKDRTKIIFINGMRRSGNHYLMKTLMDSSSTTVIFYNNQDPYGGLDVRNGVQTKYRFSKHILLIVGYEDLSISDYYQSCHFFSQSYLKGVKSLKLLVIRDLRNIMASRLNHAHMAKNLKHRLEIQEQTKELWKDHHNVFGDSSYNIIRYNNLINDLNKIHLNLFFIQNLKESKKILNRYGGGSSFDGEQFNSRYVKFEKDKTFLFLLSGLEEQDQVVHGPW